MEVKYIRKLFLEFFEKNGHKVVSSSPLVPHNDPTLMFTAAGMVQFKNYFTGIETPPYKTATTSQKCVRAGGKHNDLENVGYTTRHHTFFEMLGNFSFGDYFKDHAIELAWNLLTKEFEINKDKLYVTIYHDDEEAYKIWKKLANFSDDRIIRIATSDNFWQMGDTGPCGPCSEIFYDHGDKYQGGLPGTPDEGGDRFIEIWNLVFMQYEDLAGGKRVALPKPSIDTGMGLERIAAVLQGKADNFDIDLFQNLIDASKHLSGNHTNSNSHRVIADHIRSVCFLIADGVMPSNEGRGYVLRRIMRRAMRHVHNLGYKDIMLYKLVPTLVSEMGEAYPELRRAQAVISSVLEIEENKFKDTLDKGLKILNETIGNIGSAKQLDGKVAFTLYDTYGFPLDLTKDILKAQNISVDETAFDHEMAEQKKRAKAAWSGSGEKATDEIWYKIADESGATEFLGYVLEEADCQVKALIQNGKQVEKIESGEGIVVLNQTPFYAESGGQMGDTGIIGNNTVTDAKKFAGTIFGHFVEVRTPIKVGDILKAKIDSERRNQIRANHSATHLLHKALRDTLGEHVVQKGSLVAPDRLRFDFAHPKALAADEVAMIEKKVNEMIIGNTETDTKVMPPKDAIEQGAMALFGEKYGDEVRVVKMGVSTELCGGTHVHSTGDIGSFKIISEEAIASGVRRIEAITGLAVVDYNLAKEKILKDVLSILKSSEADVVKKITALADDKKNLEKQLSNLKVESALKAEPEITKTVDGGNFIVQNLDGIAPQELRIVADSLKQRNKENSVILVISKFDGKASLIAVVSSDLVSKVSASEIAKVAAQRLGGNGGGKPDMAQAGGDNIEAIPQAISAVKELLKVG